jgi:hypothetical protein
MQARSRHSHRPYQEQLSIVQSAMVHPESSLLSIGFVDDLKAMKEMFDNTSNPESADVLFW